MMTKAKARKWRTAVNRMIKHYKGDKIQYHCSLCDLVDNECKNCLWVLFDKQRRAGYSDDYPCNSYANKKFGHLREKYRQELIDETVLVVGLRMYIIEEWAKDSLKRLHHWKERLNKIIGENK